MRYAVTGIHRLGGATLDRRHPDYDRIEALVKGVIDSLPWRDGVHDHDEFTTGAAFGVDTMAARAARRRASAGSVLRVCYPEGEWYNADALAFGNHVECVEGGYMARNDRLVAHADVLLAFPESAEEPANPRAGGGTWATVRRARRAGIEVRVYPVGR